MAFQMQDGERGDVPRRNQRVRLRAKLRTTSLVIGTHNDTLVMRGADGWSEPFVVYDSELEHLQKMLVDDDDDRQFLAMAQKRYDDELGDFAASDDCKQLVAFGRSQGDLTVPEDICAFSVPKFFRTLSRRDMKPIEEIEILDRLGPAVRTSEQDRAEAATEMLKLVPQIVKETFGALRSELAASIKAEIIAELGSEARTDGRKRGGGG